MTTKRWKYALALMLAGALMSGCSDDANIDIDNGGDNGGVAELTRAQDSRAFTVDEDKLAFDAVADDPVQTDRWTGVLDGAGYRIEVPANWNGMLVMYAHGFRGNISTLTVSNPAIRSYLIENGYAWAASSYSTNYYDVRAGVEDTNNLALRFTDIAAENGRTLNAPSKIYITGHSMGGHVTAAAIESETYATENHRVTYNGAVPKCGVVADTSLFDYFLNFTFAAQHLANMGPDMFPNTGFDAEAINDVLWNQSPPTFEELAAGTAQPADPKEGALMLQGIVENLTGGERPAFVPGFRSPYYNTVMDLGGSDGTVTGILAKNITSNVGYTYQFDNDSDLTDLERTFNDTILRVSADAGANAPRSDGLRWIPKVNGQFSVPVVTLHDLGDMFVPFSQEQGYLRNARDNGSDGMLVQRAIRGYLHCDFTLEEQERAFADMIDWEQNGKKPEGDDVLDPDVVADENYGCKFTTETRPGVAPCPE